nr:hypothetical protein CFP56_09376 [Quercus suber]
MIEVGLRRPVKRLWRLSAHRKYISGDTSQNPRSVTEERQEPPRRIPPAVSDILEPIPGHGADQDATFLWPQEPVSGDITRP